MEKNMTFCILITHLKSQILTVCRDFCLQTWIESLNVVGVDPTSEQRDPERVVYPSAIRAKAAASPLHSITVSAAPTQARDWPLEPDVKATTTTTTVKETPPLGKVPSTSEADTSTPQTLVEVQTNKEIGKETASEDLQAKKT